MEVSKYTIPFTSKGEFYNFIMDLLTNPTKASEFLNKRIKELDDCPSDLFKKAINKIAAKLDWRPEKLLSILDKLKGVNAAAVFSLVLKQIAIIIDKKYEDHILDCKELYCISMIDGSICKIAINEGKYTNMALFRSMEDAKLAIEAMKPIYKELFPDE